MIIALLLLVASTDAQAANDAARNLWTQCLAKSAAKYGKLADQPVETLADVVMTDCRFEERAIEPTLDDLRTPDGTRLSDETKGRVMDNGRRIMRAAVVKSLVDFRLKAVE